MKLARQYAGFKNVDTLIDEIRRRKLGSRGLNRTKLVAVEGGTEDLDPRDLWVIAQVCRLPIEFFTASDEQIAAAMWGLRDAVARDAPGGAAPEEERRGPDEPRRRAAWPATSVL